jgi:hypothetical protein
MSPTVHDDLELGLRELFERQADALSVGRHEWDDVPMASVTTPAPSRPARSALAVLVASAAAIALVIGIVAIAPDTGVHVAGQPGEPVAVHFATKQVTLSADSMSITAGGRQFTAGGSTVDINSDPGTRDKYTTLELAWTERGTQMRLNMYFTSDGHDWWANEIRTYNGKSPGNWIEYKGTYFRTPLGTPFEGDVDLNAADAPGHLRFANLRLRPFLPPAACKNATTRYALDPAYDRADMGTAGGFGLGDTTLLDLATCAPVTDPHTFAYDWRIADPSVALLELAADEPLRQSVTGTDPTTSMSLAAKGPGSTTLHVTARRRSTGEIVASAEIEVVVAER